MPDWFYPLMLVVILAGYVFLFLQGRAAREAMRGMERQLDGLRRQLEKREGAGPGAGAPEPVVARPDDDLSPRLDDVQRLVAGQAAAIDRLAESVERLEMRFDTQPTAAAGGGAASVGTASSGPMSPEDVAQAFLIAEGFSSITFTGRQDVEEGIRLAMRSQRGNELRHGHLTVRDGQVVDATLEVPTRQFP